MADTKQKVLLLTLVHPDLLPPVYAIAGVLRDEGFRVHILTFDSLAANSINPGANISIESAGRHHGLGLRQRLSVRRKYTARAKELCAGGQDALIAFCAFSFVCGLNVKGSIPLVYHALEMSDFLWGSIRRSPLSMVNNLIALRRVKEADLVTTPSAQRAAWLAGRCHLTVMPETVLNTTYLEQRKNIDTLTTYQTLVPEHIRRHKTILYMGSVNSQNCVHELVAAFCSSTRKDSSLLVAGMKDNSYCNEIRAMVAASNCADRIMLFPFIAGADKDALQAHADIGVCLARETSDPESKMTAPNKVGEYLAKGLYLLASETEYMKIFGVLGMASLSKEPTARSISRALDAALQAMDQDGLREKIDKFVHEFYCMQVQAKPIIEFIRRNSR
jgi:hypothetical protein